MPAVIAEIQADKLRSLAADGHEIAAHGFKHEDVSTARTRRGARAARRARPRSSTKVAGQRPAGWFSLPRPGDKFAGGAVSPNTIDLLLEGGYDYFGNGLADDMPHYWVSDFASRRAILTLPYYYHFDDQFFLLFPRKGTGLENPDALFRNWKAELDAQYKRGRHFSMMLHPHAIGWPNRLHMLEQFLDHARGLPEPVVRDQRRLRAPLDEDLPGRHASQARTDDLAGLSRQPELTAAMAVSRRCGGPVRGL